jgi:Uma2 family endonuclease
MTPIEAFLETSSEAAVVPMPFSLERYHRMIECGVLDDCHVELLNGAIVEMAPEGEPHADLNTETRDYLIALLGTTVQVRDAKPVSLPATATYRASEPEPDIAVVQRLPGGYREHHPYPENIFLIIEYSYSTLQKDLEVKAATYAAAGIVEYWVVNLRDRQLVVMRDPIDGKYQSQVTLTQGVVYPVAFPAVAIDVPRLFT